MKTYNYRLTRSRRKTVALYIEKNGELTVRAPLRMKKSDIDKFVIGQSQWIEKKLASFVAFYEQHPNGAVPYLGKNYRVVKRDIQGVAVKDDNIYAADREEIFRWLFEKAADIILERAKLYIKIMKVSPRAVKLSDAKTRWGSCSGKKSVNLSWRLIFCPITVIDYVIVHEFTHLTYMNHGAEFWAGVKSVLPDFKRERDWLKRNGKLMEISC